MTRWRRLNEQRQEPRERGRAARRVERDRARRLLE